MSNLHKERLQSLDFFRGLTMLLLLAEGTNLYYFLNVAVPENSIYQKLTLQLYHAEWHGMHFWDLIQPYFTFIIGVAMVFSLKKRLSGGAGWSKTFTHMLFRCTALFFLGIMLQSIYEERLVWDLHNILTLLSINILITFLVFQFPWRSQLVISFGLLMITEILYRYVSIDGFDQPLVKHHNFGTYIDMLFMGRTHSAGWVVFNSIPATAHMIWGVLTGRLLIDKCSTGKKINILALASLGGLLAGYGIDWLGIIPINKKICTSSFMLASGGWCLGSFLLLYWITDVKGYKKWVPFFTVIGMNPIFIYIFSRTVGRGFLNNFVHIFTKGFMGWAGLSDGIINLTTYLIVLGCEWYICYWLYKKNIFVKI